MKRNRCLNILLMHFSAIIMVQAQLMGVKVLKYPNNVLVYKSLDQNAAETNKTMNTVSSFVDPNNGWTIYIDDLRNSPPTDNTDSELGPPMANPTTVTNYTKYFAGNKQCEASITKSSCQHICRGDLIFEDNFDSMNWTKWHHEIRIAKQVGDGEFVSYQNHPENCYVNNGELHIIPSFLSESQRFVKGGSITTGTLDLTEGCTGNLPIECKVNGQVHGILPPIVSARIRSKRSFQFRYGRVEVRAKLPKGDWMFPLILLEPADNSYTSTDHASGQLRIAFTRGNIDLIDSQGNDISGRRLLGGAILSNFREIRLFSTLATEHLGNEFHNYTLIWTNEYIALELDGKEYARLSSGFHILEKTHNVHHARLWKLGEQMAPFDQEFFITLGVGVGGQSDFPDGCKNPINSYVKPWKNLEPKGASKFWKARNSWRKTWKGADAGLHVDYVRVYAL